MSTPSGEQKSTIRHPVEAVSRFGQRLWNLWRLVVAVVVGYRGEALALRAGNLTFITITSLIPIAAVILSLLHALNAERIDPLVLNFFQDILSPGSRAQSDPTIRKFLAAANSRAGGGFSFLIVLVSSGVMLRHLDASLNDVWAIRQKRPILISIGLYAGVLLIGPILVAFALLGTEGARQIVLLAKLPYSPYVFAAGSVLASTLVFSLLYKFAPHAPVPWKSAFTGGFVAGLAWEGARHLYSGIASLFFSANPVYGSLGIAPLFLMWIYVGWYIILSGARLAYAVEHADFHDEFRDILQHPRSQELIATRIAELVTRDASAGETCTTKTLSTRLKLPEQRVIDVVRQMMTANLLITTQKGDLVPARDPATLTLADLSAAVGGVAKVVKREPVRTSLFSDVARLFAPADQTSVEKLKEISWADLTTNDGAAGRKP